MQPEQLKFWQNTLNKIFDRLPKMTRNQIARRIFMKSAYKVLGIYDHIIIFQEECGELFYDHLYIEMTDMRARIMRLEEANAALRLQVKVKETDV